MMKYLRSKREKEHPLYARLRDWSDSHSEERREFVLSLWQRYEPYAPKGFLKKLQIEFHQRWWEMYLTIGFLNLGFDLSSSKCDHGPDLAIDIQGQRMFIEATAPTVGIKSDRVPEPVNNGCASFPQRECLFRLAQALTDKCEKINKYREPGLVPTNSCAIIAVSATGLNQFGTLLGSLGSGPAPLAVLAGAGPSVVTLDGSKQQYSKQRYILHRDSGSEVNMALYEDPRFKNIGGVIYSEVDLWNAQWNPEETFSIFVNPAGDPKIPEQFKNKLSHWTRKLSTDREAVWTKTAPTKGSS